MPQSTDPDTGEITVVVTGTYPEAGGVKPDATPGPPDDVSLVSEGRDYLGWVSVSVTRGIEIMPSSFVLSLTEPPAGLLLAPGAPIQLKIQGDLVITGYVDRYVTSVTSYGHKVVLTGRSKCADLVDCSAIFEDADGKEQSPQIQAATLKDVAERLARPFGIKVLAPDGDGPRLPEHTPSFTDTPFEIIDRIARYSKMLAYDTVDGDLMLAKAGSKAHASGVEQGKNMEAASRTLAMDQRFGEYRVLLSNVDLLGDLSNALGATGNFNVAHVAKDADLLARSPGRRRRFSLVVEATNGGVDLAKERAEWEMVRRVGRSQAIRVTVDNWRDRGGELWEPGRLVAIDIPSMHLTGAKWLLSEVTFRRDMQGTHADMILQPPEAFAPQPILLQPFDGQLAADLAGQSGGYAPRPSLGESPNQ